MTTARLLVGRAAELLAALLVATLAGAVTLSAVSRLPFAEPSWLPEAFAGTLVAGLVALVAWLLLRGRWADHGLATGRRGRSTRERALWVLGVVSPAVFTALHLGTLLHGTPHYLFGLGGDQSNRVPYVGRFADSAALHDVFYADAAPFYPAQWFWVGGRTAALLDTPAWAFYKLYSVATMAIAGALAFVTWRWLLGPRVAVVLGLVTAVVGVHTNAYEPYSWILICVLPQVVVATLRMCTVLRRTAGRPPARPGERRVGAGRGVTAGLRDPHAWAVTVAVGAYLGWAALDYTLIAGFAALVVGIVVLVDAWRARRDRDAALSMLAHLAVIAAISVLMALVFWHGYLLALLTGAGHEKSVANDFAPESASHWPLPMFEPSASGLLALVGLVWLVVMLWPRIAPVTVTAGARAVEDRVAATGAGVVPDGATTAGEDPRAAAARLEAAIALAVLLVAGLGWYVLSGLRSVTGHTLLPFRMIPVVSLALALAGVLGALALARWAVDTSPPALRTRTRAVAVVLAALAGIQAGQTYSEEDTQFAAAARATPPPPQDVLDAVATLTPGREPSDLVVLTSVPSMLSYRPYFSFQAPAHAYATPTGRYTERLAEIRSWAAAPDPRALHAAMTDGPFRAPDVLVLDRTPDGSLVFPALVNTMPLETNNRAEDVLFAPRAFADPGLFTTLELEGRTVIARR